jgi:hypothetical protein
MRSFVVGQRNWLTFLSATSARKSYAIKVSIGLIARRRLGILDCAPFPH